VPTLHEFATGLLDCAVVTLDEANAPVCRAFLAPGSLPSFDNCCLCGNGNAEGQLWVALVQSNPVNPFYGSPCARDFTITYRMGITRCAHTLDDMGNPPTPAQLDEDAAKIYRDRALLIKAVTCCFANEFDLDPQEYAIGSGEINPVQGGCLSQTLEVLVRSAECSDC
jgi:hypothetical protein